MTSGEYWLIIAKSTGRKWSLPSWLLLTPARVMPHCSWMQVGTPALPGLYLYHSGRNMIFVIVLFNLATDNTFWGTLLLEVTRDETPRCLWGLIDVPLVRGLNAYLYPLWRLWEVVLCVAFFPCSVWMEYSYYCQNIFCPLACLCCGLLNCWGSVCVCIYRPLCCLICSVFKSHGFLLLAFL